MAKRLVFNVQDCIGCRLCELACSGKHEGCFNPHAARLRINNRYTRDGVSVEARVCDCCGRCAKVCPTGALTLRENGLDLNIELCKFCGFCVDECPQGLISLDYGAAPRICDMCGGDPACVAWCPRGALRLEEVTR